MWFKAILDLFNSGCGDMHSLVAKMTYKDQIGDCPIEEVKSKFKNLRQEAKGVEFAINILYIYKKNNLLNSWFLIGN